MMIRNLLALVVGATIVGSASAQAQPKIGTVDVNRVIKEYSKMRDAEAKVKEATTAANREFDERADTYKKAIEELNRLGTQLEAPGLTADAKSAREKERDEKLADVQSLQQEISDFRLEREQQLQQHALGLREGILQEITEGVIESVRTKGVDVVLDKSATADSSGLAVILFARDTLDFTGDVLATLERKAAAAPAKAASPAAGAASPAPARAAPASPAPARAAPASPAPPRAAPASPAPARGSTPRP